MKLLYIKISEDIVGPMLLINIDKRMNDYSVFLRALEQDDYLLINKWRNDKKIQEKTMGLVRYVSSEMEKAWVHDKMLNNVKEIYLAICSIDTKDMVGYTSINNIDYINRKAFGGGTVIGNENYRNGKTLIDTSLLLFEHVFDHLGLNRYSGACLETHIDSRSMMEMMGFRLEGIELESVFKFHKYHNVCKYVLLSSDYYKILSEGGYDELAIAKRLRCIKKKFKIEKINL